MKKILLTLIFLVVSFKILAIDVTIKPLTWSSYTFNNVNYPPNHTGYKSIITQYNGTPLTWFDMQPSGQGCFLYYYSATLKPINVTDFYFTCQQNFNSFSDKANAFRLNLLQQQLNGL